MTRWHVHADVDATVVADTQQDAEEIMLDALKLVGPLYDVDVFVTAGKPDDT